MNISERPPNFSIIIPTYNRPTTVVRALQSVAEQSYKDFEVLVIDDCSSNSPQTRIEEFKRKNPELDVQYHHQKENKGVSAARNLAIKKASGNYIVFLDDDDELPINYLEKSVIVIQQASSNTFFASDLLQKFQDSEKAKVKVRKDPRITYGTGMIFPANGFKKVGLLDESLKTLEDVDLSIRFLLAGYQYQRITSTQLIMNIEDQPSLTRNQSSEQWIRNEEAILEKHHAHWNKIKKLHSYRHFTLASAYYRNNKRSKARMHIKQAFLSNPFYLKTIELFLRFELLKRS